MRIAMLQDEVTLLTQFLAQSTSYCEFGMGGSTTLAASTVQGPVVSIDSSTDWISNVRNALPPSDYVRQLLHADIGPTGDWGAPVSTSNRQAFLNYHEHVWNEIEGVPDLLLVDGRFRAACFCQVLLRGSSETVIGVHDYRPRSYYHVIENIAKPIAETSGLTFFLARKTNTKEGVSRILEEYKYDWF